MHFSNLLTKLRCDMKIEIIEKAEEIISERRRKNLAPYEEKMAKLNKNAEFLKLQNELNKEIIENTRKEVYGEKFDKTKEIELKKKNDAFLKKENVPQIKFSCPICEDKGFINGKMCACLKKEISNILFEESNFGNLVSFSDAEQGATGELKKLYALMKKWCHSDFKKNLVFISGAVGSGKTYLTKAIANELIEMGKIVKLSSAFQMSRDFKEYRYSYDESIMDKYLSCEFLFIDDLGTETIYKNSTIEFLFHVINERKMKKVCTIITSNLDLSEIRDRYDERIFSRISDPKTSITIQIHGDDLRLKK